MKDKFFYSFVKPIVRFIIVLLFRPKVIGLDNIPKEGRVILAGNHTKWLDPVMLVSINKRQLHFLAKEELFHGVTKFIVLGMGCIPVNRKIHDKDALESAYKTLEIDNVIGIFPEGTINRTDDVIMPFKMGAVKMSEKTNSPIVPFGITGKYKLFGKNRIRIEFFKPFVVNDLENDNKKLERIVSECLIENNKEN